LMDLIASNLRALETLVDYNIENHILLFRISSDVIPFGSSVANRLAWWDLFKNSLDRIGEKIRSSGMRVSMHPGQYTVLNSPTEEVVARALEDLVYHARFLESLGVDASSKIILHIGGIYGEKEKAIERFVTVYKTLSPEIKRHLVLENDDRSYTIQDVLEISQKTGAPVVFDNLHHALNPSPIAHTDPEWINLAKKTWKPIDGPQKIHYSQPDKNKRSGAHSANVKLDTFLRFVKALGRDDIDIMLEVKDKNLSALKCQNVLAIEKVIKVLEKEWSRYKYTVLEHSHAIYLKIRDLLKDKTGYPALEFYHLLETALALPIETKAGVNAAEHVWGYFKRVTTPAEKKTFARLLEAYQSGHGALQTVKNQLRKMTYKYNEKYLTDSLYFDL
ncbi:MAG: UV DNA damage repair endonuclease UvsE, partial [Firmicutes bacterium]|nr:UV DNA damage repair endonuclease UvsE [Bacillota bacterium]